MCRLRLIVLYVCGFFIAQSAVGQNTGVLQRKKLALADTLILDSLSISPATFSITTSNGEKVDSSYYLLDAAKSRLLLKTALLKKEGMDSIAVSYRTFPVMIGNKVYRKNPELIRPDLLGIRRIYEYKVKEISGEDFFKTEGLTKNGSIARGISFGNNQDVVLNSNLNLQVSGKLTKDIDLVMAATDNNVPIQPDGNTQQLQQFDKVYIQLSDARNKLIAGDFQLFRPNSYFMNFNKRAQGLDYTNLTLLHPETTDSARMGLLRTSASIAVSKGKFARNILQGIEGNQGPYRLRGNENEAFIIVLAGTERVFIDGRLMERGQDRDYMIDYNTSEVTFTPRNLITKDRRIIVEFQYSDKNYARSLLHYGNDYREGPLQLRLHIYSEQDSKNQPLQQDLSPEQKQLLADVGDTLTKAVYPAFDSVAYNTAEVLYRRLDTTVASVVYPGIFVYSIVDSLAHYRVQFSNVGMGNGDYVLTSSAANGKVFKWVAPINGIKQGDYIPYVPLITPKKKQLLTAAADYQIGKQTKIGLETAISNNDINTFSSIDKKNDRGVGVKLLLDDLRMLKTRKDSARTSWSWQNNLTYEMISHNFSPIERFRAVEFERDWNRVSTQVLNEQHLLSASTGISKGRLFSSAYRIQTFLEGTSYKAWRHFFNGRYNNASTSLNYDGSFLQTNSPLNNTRFYRHKSLATRRIKGIQLGYRDEMEKNEFRNPASDTLLHNSYRFWEWESFIANADTTKNKFTLRYRQRTDSRSIFNQLFRTAFAESWGGTVELNQHPGQLLRVSAAYRRLYILKQNLLPLQRPDNTIVGRIEYNFKLLKGSISSSTFYEIGSGLEQKKQFSYIKVSKGQGVYAWIDYNDNNIEELNEFEIAVLMDKAEYIRVFTPTNEYVKVYTNQFSQSINLMPAAYWGSKQGWRKFLARFADQAAYRVDRKSNNADLTESYNPFLSAVADSTLLSLNSSFRNSIYFNQTDPVFGIEYNYQDVRNKILLVNGYDSRLQLFHEGRIRWNMNRNWSLFLSYRNGNKSSGSQYFNNRNYRLAYQEAEPKLSYQTKTSFRLSAFFKYTEKQNAPEYGNQHAVLQDYGLELKYNILNKASIQAKANYIQIQYRGELNNSIAFEMLNALNPGRNITWGLAVQQDLSNNMQLSVTYDGRSSQGVKVVHIGGMQVRAFF